MLLQQQTHFSYRYATLIFFVELANRLRQSILINVQQGQEQRFQERVVVQKTRSIWVNLVF